MFNTEPYVNWMFFTVNVMVIGCFSLLTLCYSDVFHCERYFIWMFFTLNVMLIGCIHCERYVLWMFLTVNVMLFIDQTWLVVRCHLEWEFRPLSFSHSMTIQGPESTC